MKGTGQRINFTKRSLEAIVPSQKRLIVYDNQIRSLGISVTPLGTKTFLVYRKINGTPRKITVGKFPDMTVEQARRKAQKILSQIADGKDPNSELILAKQRSITLQEVLDDYLTVRKDLKPITLRDYRLLLKEYFPDWQSKPIIQITKDMVLQRHREIGERSKARANYAMRLLRALFNFSAAQYEASDGTKLYPDNPTKRLSETRSWYKVERRKTFIKPHELPKWFQAVNNLKQLRSDELTFAIKHYLLLLLFTGLRREELAQLKWENVDLQDRSFTLKSHTTKNREEHVVPMSGYVASIFETLHEARDGPYVFPGKDSKAYLKSPRKHMLRVTKESGVSFNLHDLRRTFITIAESLDISIFTIKRLINHKISQDVTGGYIISYTDRLRKATQMVTDHILQIINTSTTSLAQCTEIA